MGEGRTGADPLDEQEAARREEALEARADALVQKARALRERYEELRASAQARRGAPDGEALASALQRARRTMDGLRPPPSAASFRESLRKVRARALQVRAQACGVMEKALGAAEAELAQAREMLEQEAAVIEAVREEVREVPALPPVPELPAVPALPAVPEGIDHGHGHGHDRGEEDGHGLGRRLGQGQEGRRDPRVKMQAVIDFASDSNVYSGFSTNISEGGLFVATVQLVPIGTEVDISFTLPGSGELQVKGVVRWRREVNDSTPDVYPGLGIQFVDPPAPVLEALASFVAEREPLFYPD